MPMPRPPAGRHAVTQRADEIVVHLGHRLLFRQAGQLLAEKLLLQVGIVQLGVGVGHFHALDEQLEPLGNRRIARLALGQRANARRIVDHEDRPRQGVFHLLLEDETLDHVGVFADRVEADAARPAWRCPAASSAARPVCSANSSS